MPREFARHERLGNQVLRTLSELLRTETKDPRLRMVSLTRVELTRDLGVARVYFSALDPRQEVPPVLEGLESAAGFLRGKLGRSIEVRHVPELRFFHDDSAAEAVRIGQLIDSAREADDSASREDG